MKVVIIKVTELQDFIDDELAEGGEYAGYEIKFVSWNQGQVLLLLSEVVGE